MLSYSHKSAIIDAGNFKTLAVHLTLLEDTYKDALASELEDVIEHFEDEGTAECDRYASAIRELIRCIRLGDDDTKASELRPIGELAEEMVQENLARMDGDT